MALDDWKKRQNFVCWKTELGIPKHNSSDGSASASRSKSPEFQSHSGSYKTCFKECAVLMHILVIYDQGILGSSWLFLATNIQTKPI